MLPNFTCLYIHGHVRGLHVRASSFWSWEDSQKLAAQSGTETLARFSYSQGSNTSCHLLQWELSQQLWSGRAVQSGYHDDAFPPTRYIPQFVEVSVAKSQLEFPQVSGCCSVLFSCVLVPRLDLLLGMCTYYTCQSLLSPRVSDTHTHTAERNVKEMCY